jgi:hypothetical protein
MGYCKLETRGRAIIEIQRACNHARWISEHLAWIVEKYSNLSTRKKRQLEAIDMQTKALVQMLKDFRAEI